MSAERTQVGIVGAGPAGLMLSHLLGTAGIDSVVLEAQSRAYVEARVRAGVLEAGTVTLLESIGVADRLHAEGLVHDGVILQFGDIRHRIDFKALTGQSVTVYGQQEVVRDMIAARLAQGRPLQFEVSEVAYEGLDSDAPVICYRHDGQEVRLRCDVIAGCDGSHGASQRYLSVNGVRTYERDHPFAWLGILARVAPSVDELVYASGPAGFALHSMRSLQTSRLYVQVEPEEDIDRWPDERVWAELHRRLAHPGWSLAEGPVVEKSITPMRSHVVEPMRFGRLFLAGDAAHIVPPTGAKGLNLAITDVAVLADALIEWYARGDTAGLEGYSDRCLSRVWRVQDFSTSMTTLLHRDPTADAFTRRIQQARQAEIVRSHAASLNLAENYVGLPLRTRFT
ncbi:MAG: 4-hydroxybenzoate 3-monooxygenase [Acidimicrobiaceae bacterium]|nr:4-hydroxybenzoate 3-monooxygenase [Acidimicrobiaceae bacterium]